MMAFSGTILPAVAPKPFDQMTIEELQRERNYWDRYIDEHASGMSLAVARDCLLVCDALLARRASEPKPPLTEPPNGVVGPSVALSHRVPVLEADPVIKSEGHNP